MIKIDNIQEKERIMRIEPLNKKSISICIAGSFKEDWKWANGILFSRGLRKLKQVDNIEFFDLVHLRNNREYAISQLLTLAKRNDAIIIFKGFNLSEDIIKELRMYTRVFLWWMDWWPAFFAGHEYILNLSRLCHYRSATGFETALYWNEKIGLPCYHIVDGSDNSLFYPQTKTKKYDILFVGMCDHERNVILNFIQKSFPRLKTTFCGPGFENNSKRKNIISYPEANNMYSQSKILLNINRGNLIGYTSSRLWDMMATKSFILTKPMPEMETYFELESGKHLVEFKNLLELKDLIEYYIKNESERNDIAENAFNHFNEKRQYLYSASEVVNTILNEDAVYSIF